MALADQSDYPDYDESATPQECRRDAALLCLECGIIPAQLLTDIYAYLHAQLPGTVPSGNLEVAVAYVLGRDDDRFDNTGRVLGLVACALVGCLLGILIGLFIASQVVGNGLPR
jgi:hypothetical protein